MFTIVVLTYRLANTHVDHVQRLASSSGNVRCRVEVGGEDRQVGGHTLLELDGKGEECRWSVRLRD